MKCCDCSVVRETHAAGTGETLGDAAWYQRHKTDDPSQTATANAGNVKRHCEIGHAQNGELLIEAYSAPAK